MDTKDSVQLFSVSFATLLCNQYFLLIVAYYINVFLCSSSHITASSSVRRLICRPVTSMSQMRDFWSSPYHDNDESLPLWGPIYHTFRTAVIDAWTKEFVRDKAIFIDVVACSTWYNPGRMRKIWEFIPLHTIVRKGYTRYESYSYSRNRRTRGHAS